MGKYHVTVTFTSIESYTAEAASAEEAEKQARTAYKDACLLIGEQRITPYKHIVLEELNGRM